MMNQKLVRDNIPAIIEKNGETCVTRKLTDKEYETALAEKLQEEVAELLEAYTAKKRSAMDCTEEIADVMEVLYAMGKTCAHHTAAVYLMTDDCILIPRRRCQNITFNMLNAHTNSLMFKISNFSDANPSNSL